MNWIPQRVPFLLLAGAALLSSSCRSMAPSTPAPTSSWSPLAAELPEAWRDLHLYGGEYAFVLASSEAAARQVHNAVQSACQLFVDELGHKPRPGLLIAGSQDDPLLVEGAEEMIAALQRWNAAATGRAAPPPQAWSRRGRGADVPPELAARLLCGAIPVDEPSLDLPIALRERIAYVLLLPTEECIEATCAVITDLALEREGVSWIQLKFAQAIVGHPTDLLTREMRGMFFATLLDVVSASAGLDAESAARVLARAVASGVLPARASRSAARRDAQGRGGESGR